MKPVLFVTGHVPAYRVGRAARACTSARASRWRCSAGAPATAARPSRGELPFPRAHGAGRASSRALAASGRYRAVVCSDRRARRAAREPGPGARAGGVPLILWASLWAHPRTPAHALSYLPLRRLYRSADAVVTYGPHVSAYVRARGARNVHVAPQAVDNDFWRAPGARAPALPRLAAGSRTRFLFVGRPAPEKGLDGAARRLARSRAPAAARARAGGRRRGAARSAAARDGRRLALGALDARAAARGLRRMRRAGRALDRHARRFREPWGLVVNEAMNRGLAVIASDAVGAAAGGLVRDGENGAGRARRRRGALARRDRAPGRPSRSCASAWARPGRRTSRAYTYEAWAEGFSRGAGDASGSPAAAGSVRRSSYENRAPQSRTRPAGACCLRRAVERAARDDDVGEHDHPALHPRQVARRLHARAPTARR